jgi:hypothetical protein
MLYSQLVKLIIHRFEIEMTEAGIIKKYPFVKDKNRHKAILTEVTEISNQEQLKINNKLIIKIK